MKTTEAEKVEPEAGGMSADALEDLQRAAPPASLPRAVAQERGAACRDQRRPLLWRPVVMFTSQTNSATETQPTHLGQPTTLQEEMKTTNRARYAFVTALKRQTPSGKVKDPRQSTPSPKGE